MDHGPLSTVYRPSSTAQIQAQPVTVVILLQDDDLAAVGVDLHRECAGRHIPRSVHYLAGHRRGAGGESRARRRGAGRRAKSTVVVDGRSWISDHGRKISILRNELGPSHFSARSPFSI